MKKPIKNGFTLVEIAIVMFIMALMLGTGLTLLSAQQDQRKIEDNTARLNEVHEALIGFAITYGRLPCPTQASLATGQINAGEEALTGNTCACQSTTGPSSTIADLSASKVACVNTTVTGVLPWAKLGISETDAWGHRFTYRVTTIFADDITAITYGCTPPTAPTQSSFALCSNGNLAVLSTVGGSNVASTLPAVVVSHGTNGLGAYTPTGQQILPIAAANTNETENANNDINFVSHTTAPAGETGGYFDDQVIWLSQYTLFNRMVQAGKLP
ncbi:MAG: prepilin-type N-terminal cleavage/methylation domain-containing protein [Gallionella sp.]|nr:prepilin-type N-terminal cleavage/methylation domain-containing protein [Gallionella sp.]